MPSLTYLDCSAAWWDEDAMPGSSVESFLDKLHSDGPLLEIVIGGKFSILIPPMNVFVRIR